MIIDYDQIQKLIDSNLEVKISKESVNSSKAKMSSLGASFIPEVSLYAQAESANLSKISKEPSSGVIANINLFNGLRDVEQIKVNTLAYESSKLESKKTYNVQVLEARKNYFEALKILENIKILSEHEVVNRSNRNQILKKVTSGVSPRSEELIFKKIELDLKEQRIKEENALRLVFSNLRKILTLEPNEKIEIVGSFDISKFEYKLGQKKLDLALVESAESKSISEKKLSGLWRMPRVNFYAERSFTDHVNGEFIEEGDEKQLFGLRITLPLLSEKNIESIEDQIKKTELTSAQLRKKQQFLELASNEEKLIVSLDHLKTIIDISKEKVTLSKDIMERTFSEFKIGLKEALSLNEATAEYLEARKDLIGHQLEYIISVEEANASNLH
jgi:outer membrane protein